jgi:hypothetical protein
LDFEVAEIQQHLRSEVAALSLDFPSNGPRHSVDHAKEVPIEALRSKRTGAEREGPEASEAY